MIFFDSTFPSPFSDATVQLWGEKKSRQTETLLQRDAFNLSFFPPPPWQKPLFLYLAEHYFLSFFFFFHRSLPRSFSFSFAESQLLRDSHREINFAWPLCLWKGTQAYINIHMRLFQILSLGTETSGWAVPLFDHGACIHSSLFPPCVPSFRSDFLKTFVFSARIPSLLTSSHFPLIGLLTSPDFLCIPSLSHYDFPPSLSSRHVSLAVPSLCSCHTFFPPLFAICFPPTLGYYLTFSVKRSLSSRHISSIPSVSCLSLLCANFLPSFFLRFSGTLLHYPVGPLTSHASQLAQISVLKSRSSALSASNSERFQTAMTVHWFPKQPASSLDEDTGGTRVLMLCSKQEVAASNCSENHRRRPVKSSYREL